MLVWYITFLCTFQTPQKKTIYVRMYLCVYISLQKYECTYIHICVVKEKNFSFKIYKYIKNKNIRIAVTLTILGEWGEMQWRWYGEAIKTELWLYP